MNFMGQSPNYNTSKRNRIYDKTEYVSSQTTEDVLAGFQKALFSFCSCQLNSFRSFKKEIKAKSQSSKVATWGRKPKKNMCLYKESLAFDQS